MKRKKRKRYNKKQAQNMHAKRRALERLGMKYNKYARKQIIGMIHRGEVEFLERQTNRVAKYKIKYQGREFVVCYDRNRKTIITFMKCEEEGGGIQECE